MSKKNKGKKKRESLSEWEARKDKPKRAEEEKDCQCNVCVAWRESGLQLFRLSMQTEDDILDYYFFAIGKTYDDFERIVKKGAKKSRQITERSLSKGRMGLTINQCCDFLRIRLREEGFVYVGDMEAGYACIQFKHPEAPAWMHLDGSGAQ